MVMYTSFVRDHILQLDYAVMPGATEVANDILTAPVDRDSEMFFQRKNKHIVDDKVIRLGCELGKKAYTDVIENITLKGFKELKHNEFEIPEEHKEKQDV